MIYTPTMYALHKCISLGNLNIVRIYTLDVYQIWWKANSQPFALLINDCIMSTDIFYIY